MTADTKLTKDDIIEKTSYWDAMKENDEEIRLLLTAWATATRMGAQDEILINHLPDALIFDVLPPMKYEGTAAYRASWADWQPETQGDSKFNLVELSISSSGDCAFASCFIECGGTLPDGSILNDLVRATFCLRRTEGAWKIAHQHISKPFENKKDT